MTPAACRSFSRAARNPAGADSRAADPDRQYLPPADVVVEVAEHYERERGADDIGGADHGDPERAET
jgi:predicted anti-sigma-YlaC factor YlaD